MSTVSRGEVTAWVGGKGWAEKEGFLLVVTADRATAAVHCGTLLPTNNDNDQMRVEKRPPPPTSLKVHRMAPVLGNNIAGLHTLREYPEN